MKVKFYLLLLIIGRFLSCQQSSSNTAKIKKGMAKVAILYPMGEGKIFNMEYYENRHMPMAADLFGDDLKAIAIDKGIAGGAPNSPATYVAIGYFYFEDMPTLQKSMEQHSEKLRADVMNYTNIQPVLQISEVVTAE